MTCSVCGDRVGRGPNGFGVIQHAKKHRRQYKQLVGKEPDSYQDVRDLLADSDEFTPGDQVGLGDYQEPDVVQATLADVVDF